MARPPVPQKKTVPPGGYKLIKTMAARGCRKMDIAYALKMSPRTFDRVVAEDPKAMAAWENGRAEEHAALRNKLFEAAMDGNITAAIFLLKSAFGYVDRPTGDAIDAGRVTVEFKMPAALAPEQYVTLLKAEGNK